MLHILSRIITTGFYGDIKFDGISINEFELNSYRKNVYMLTQKPLILEGTLKDNIILFNADITDEDILFSPYYEILSVLVIKLSNGLDAWINDTGNNLSVGEKQKICLLRMFLRKPKIMLLDEPFTGLDFESQNLLRKELELYKEKNNALIIIASHQGIGSKFLNQRIVLS